MQAVIVIIGESRMTDVYVFKDFRKRFLSLLSYKFRDFSSVTALSILEGANAGELASKKQSPLSQQEIKDLFSPYDMKRLVSYSNNMLDYHVILDLLPSLATLYFQGRFSTYDCKLTGVQSSILLALGLQRKEIEDVEKELKLPVAQSLALFVKIIRKLVKTLEDIQKSEIDKTIPQQSEEEQSQRQITHTNGTTAAQSLAADLDAGADEATSALRAQQREIIDSLDLDQYKIANQEGDDSAWQNFKNLSKVVSVKNPAAAGAKRKEREEKDTPSKSDGEQKKHKKDKKHKKHAP